MITHTDALNDNSLGCIQQYSRQVEVEAATLTARKFCEAYTDKYGVAGMLTPPILFRIDCFQYVAFSLSNHAYTQDEGCSGLTDGSLSLDSSSLGVGVLPKEWQGMRSHPSVRC